MHVHATARNRALVETNEVESEHREQNDRERDDGETGRVDRRAGCVGECHSSSWDFASPRSRRWPQYLAVEVVPVKDYSDLQWRDRSGITPDSCRTIALSCELLHPAGRRVNPSAPPHRSALVRRRDVENDLELQQRRPGRHRLLPLTGVRLPGRTVAPRCESLFALPLRDDEVAVLALHRTEELEAE